MIRILCKDTYLSEKWKVKSEKKEAANKEPLFYRNDIWVKEYFFGDQKSVFNDFSFLTLHFPLIKF